MLLFSSYKLRNIPIASLFPLTPHVTFLTVRKHLFQAVQIGILSLLEFAEEIPIFEKRCGKPLKKSYKWLILFKHVLPKEAAQLETLPEGRIGSPQTTWELLAWSSTVRGPSSYSPCPCAEAIQQTSCHYSAWWASKHWALRGQEKPQSLSHCHVPLILNHYMPVLFFPFCIQCFHSGPFAASSSSHWGFHWSNSKGKRTTAFRSLVYNAPFSQLTC